MAITLEEVRQSPHRTPFNLWRRETPDAEGWSRTPRAEDPNKYFMFSADSHAVEPPTYLTGIDAGLMFPSRGLLCWATPDPVFAMAMCRTAGRTSSAARICRATRRGFFPPR